MTYRKSLIPFLKTTKILQINERINMVDLKAFLNKYNIFCFLGLSKSFSLKIFKKNLVSVEFFKNI